MKKKKGSALIFVLLMLTAVIILCVGMIEISMTSLKQSSAYYDKNNAFYYANSALNELIYNIDDKVSKARKKANDDCFLPGGGPNLKNPVINDAYQKYLRQCLQGNSKEEEYKSYENTVKWEYIYLYKKYIRDNIFYGEDQAWSDVKTSVENKFNSEGNTVEVYKYDDPSLEPALKGNRNSTEFEYLGDDKDFGSVDFPRETVYIKAKMGKTGVTRYAVCTFEMNPYGTETISFNTAKIKIGYNKIFDYALLSGRNLIAVNGNSTFEVDGDVYAKGTSNVLDAKDKDGNNIYLPSACFGGILAGMDSENFNGLKPASGESNKINPTDLTDEQVLFTGGNIRIKGNAYVGLPYIKNNSASELWNKYCFAGGFVKTIGPSSNIDIVSDNSKANNLYCHSVITEEGSENSSINIDGDCYVADNVSLYGKDSHINIKQSLKGFELADSDTNYNSSPSIVVNDQTAGLYVGKNVVLFGVAFVDGLKSKNGGMLFKTAETASINPNFLSYSYVNSINGYSDYANEYSIRGVPFNMFDIRKAGDPSLGVSYILDYIYSSMKTPTKDNPNLGPAYFDTIFNFGYNDAANKNIIDMPNIKFQSNVDDTSYFPFLLPNRNKIYVAMEPEKPESNKKYKEDLKNSILNTDPSNPRYVVLNNGNDMGSIMGELRSSLNNKKNEFVKRALFRDKGIDTSESFDDYFNWGKNVLINDNTNGNKYFIKINSSKEDIKLIITDEADNPSEGKINVNSSYNILLITKGNVIIDNQSQYKANLKGNIVADGDVLIKGNSINLIGDKSAALYFSYNNPGEYSKLVDFLSKGVTTFQDITLVNTVKRSNKSNIKIINRRQIVK